MSFVYLASPFSHDDAAVRDARRVAACKVAARLMHEGIPVFSPIAHSCAIEEHFKAPEGFNFWMLQDIPILVCASKLVVLMLDGWRESRGVTRELEIARQFCIPTEYLDA